MPESPSADPHKGPAIPVEVLRKRVLDLIGSLQSLDDLERPHLSSILQADFAKVSDRPERYLNEGRTSAGWEYGISVARPYGRFAPFEARIGLENGVEPWSNQKPTYCTMDFESLAQDIVVSGFKREPKRSTFGGKPSWEFSKEVPQRRLIFVVSIPLYYLGDGFPAGQACVKAIKVQGIALDE